VLKHYAANKNPLHPSALRPGDLTVGKRIIIFNTELGIIEESMILEKPHLDSSDTVHMFVITVRDSNGQKKTHGLESIGVIPNSFYGWDHQQFTIDMHKKHLLPEIDSERSWPTPPTLHEILHPTEKNE
jgi:hypothetical protein